MWVCHNKKPQILILLLEILLERLKVVLTKKYYLYFWKINIRNVEKIKDLTGGDKYNVIVFN